MAAGRLSVVVGGMFGSEAKGHVTAWLASTSERLVSVVRVAGPNAGHSAVGVLEGKTWATRQIPIAAVTRLDAQLVIAAGSEVDPEVLIDEIKMLDEAGYQVSGRLFVDASATVLTPEHRERENKDGLTARLGSTAKGIGAARVDRLMRKASVIRDCPELANFCTPDTAGELVRQLKSDQHVIIEGTQGYGLGLHTEYYPYGTSSDCRAVDFLAMAGLSPWGDVPQPEVWVVVRPYPIRVAGNSGPLKGETSWEELGLPEERTTVTKKVRRVGTFDPDLVRKAVQANGGKVYLALSMLDQVVPEVAGWAGSMRYHGNPDVDLWSERVEHAAGDGSRVVWMGTGPGTSIFDDRLLAQMNERNLEFVHESTVPTTESSLAYEGDLSEWWLLTAHEEVCRTVPKAVEYGSGDLVEIGRTMAQAIGRKVSDEEAAELGIWFYSVGKLARWSDAVKRGDRCSDDTLFDLGVYVRMAQRVRAAGGWPGK